MFICAHLRHLRLRLQAPSRCVLARKPASRRPLRGKHLLLAWGGERRFFAEKEVMKKYIITLVAVSSLGLLVGCNQSVKTASQEFNELPPAVQKTVRAQAPNAEIVSVTQKTVNGGAAYQVEFHSDQGTNPKVLVAANGDLLGSDLSHPAGAIQKFLTPTGALGTPFSALPLAVQKTIQEQAPHAQISSITRHDENGRTVYEVNFSGQNPSIQVAQDGTLVTSK